jgi:hypothetical protein
MAASELAHALRAQRSDLLSHLISAVLGTQPADDNHELAFEFCLHHTGVHGFHLDTNPRDVDTHLDECGPHRVGRPAHHSAV